MNKQSILNSIKIIILGVLFSGVAAYAQSTWVSPPQAPNSSLPINVGESPAYDQLKTGGLTLGSLAVFGLSQFNQNTSATFDSGGGLHTSPAGLFYVSGKMGVGIVAPTERLDVDGKIRIRGIAVQGGGVLCARPGGLIGTSNNIGGAC